MKTLQKLKKLICAFVAFLLILTNATGAAFAVEKQYDYQYRTENALFFLESKIEMPLSDYLIAHAGTSEADWIALYITASGQSEKFKSAEYLSALGNKLTDTGPTMDRLRMSLLLAVLGENPKYIQNTIYECAEKLSEMSHIYGLMLAKSVNFNDTDFISKKTTALIEMQKENGGFGISSSSDPDITAMAIYALSYQKDVPEVRASIDRAIAYLSATQDENGGFTSMGKANSESCAQVILALCSIGVNPETDTRFIKNNYNPIDALLSYSNENGSFSHTNEPEGNITATRQALYALFACSQLSNGGDFIFNSPLDLTLSPVVTDISTTEPTDESTSGNPADPPAPKNGSFYKLITILLVATVFLILIITNLITKRLNKKKIFALVLLAIICISILSLLKFESKNEYYSGNYITTQDQSQSSISVSILIDCTEAEDISTYSHYPQNGVVFSNDNITVNQGDSVFELLLKITKSEKIQLDYSESFGTVYIKGINYLYEFDGGSNSGWMYTVNGISADVAINKYILSEGDIVKIIYTTDYSSIND